MRKTLANAGVVAATTLLGFAIGTGPASAASYSWAGNDGSGSDGRGVHLWGTLRTYDDGRKISLNYHVNDTARDNRVACGQVLVFFTHDGSEPSTQSDRICDNTGSGDRKYGHGSQGLVTGAVEKVQVVEDWSASRWHTIYPR
ncbi:hypothetical protein [Streptomyces sp. NPDC002611]